MFFSNIFSFAVLLATAAADLHTRCECINGNSWNPTLTKAACDNYAAAKYKWGIPTYDSVRNFCTGVNTVKLAGDQWETACKTVAKTTSFPCTNGEDVCWASVDSVRGACN